MYKYLYLYCVSEKMTDGNRAFQGGALWEGRSAAHLWQNWRPNSTLACVRAFVLPFSEFPVGDTTLVPSGGAFGQLRQEPDAHAVCSLSFVRLFDRTHRLTTTRGTLLDEAVTPIERKLAR
jgi:hypothetical protein